MSAASLALEVFRYHPDFDEGGHWAEYAVACEDGESLLDVLLRVRATLDPTLAFRASCRAGACGGCGVSVDGRPVVACSVLASDLGSTFRVAPLANLAIVRDLVVDLAPLEEGARSILPFADAPPSGAPDSDACTECGLCYAVCPEAYRDEHFVGPAALHRAFSLGTRGDGPVREQRRQVLSGPGGVWGCTECGSCTRICPSGLDPAAAARGLKIELPLRVREQAAGSETA